MDWPPESFGEQWSSDYDDRAYDDTDDAVAVVHSLAGPSGSVLELGVGTGRLAIPAAKLGLRVWGIDASRSMLETLSRKKDAELVRTAVADFSNFELGERFDVVLLSCNTLFDLPTQERQIECFASAARHLSARGVLIVEASVPTVFTAGQSIRISEMGDDHLRLETIKHYPHLQQVHRLRTTIAADGGPLFRSTRNRYIWPSEMDLMARLAGLHLRDRWGGWTLDTFGAQCDGHVSTFTPEPARAD